jgi:cytochrome c peroxidase
MVTSPAWLSPGFRAGLRTTGQPIHKSPAYGRLPICMAMFLALAVAAASQPGREQQEPISPVSPPESIDMAKIALGEALFRDVRLSRDGTAACTSCHRLDEGGDDGRARSIAADGGLLDFNSPTVFNAALNFRLNWRGNFRALEEQNEAVLLDPSLMNTSWEELLPKLRGEPTYADGFAAAYGSAPDRENVLDALGAFQRSLVTPDARFDRYLRGERSALTAEEVRGYELFMDYGCIACHQGANVGGNLFQKFGIFANPFANQETRSDGDLGRFTITGQERDRHVFRVPSLRNVALTAPYFHDGRTASLAEAVKIMAGSQLGRELPDPDIRSIVSFLNTLTGEYRSAPKASERNGPQQ